MNVQVITVPYDSGHEAERMGRGPLYFIDSGLGEVLSAAGHQVNVARVDSERSFRTEVGTAFELHRKVAGLVRAAREVGDFPIVLAGNCGLASLGTIAGLDESPLGI